MKSRPFSRGLSIVSGILCLVTLSFSLLSVYDYSRLFTARLAVNSSISIAVWISWVVLAVAMFMRSGTMAGIGLILQAAARLAYVVYYAFIYYPTPYYYFRTLYSYPVLFWILALILLAIACFRKKMGIPMACISMSLIYFEVCFDAIVRMVTGGYGLSFIVIDQLYIVPALAAVSLLFCAYSLFSGSYLPKPKKV